MVCDDQRMCPGKQSFRSLVQTVPIQTGRTVLGNYADMNF